MNLPFDQKYTNQTSSTNSQSQSSTVGIKSNAVTNTSSTKKKCFVSLGISVVRRSSSTEKTLNRGATSRGHLSKQHVNKQRWQVTLPFDTCKSSESLGESGISVLYCVYSTKKRFESNQLLKQRYHDYIQKLIESQHLESVPENRINIPLHERFYLPHHGTWSCKGI